MINIYGVILALYIGIHIANVTLLIYINIQNFKVG